MPMTLRDIEQITVLLMPMEDMANLPTCPDDEDDITAFENREARNYVVQQICDWADMNLGRRELFALTHRCGLYGEKILSYSEIAERLGCSKSSARVYYTKAVARLKKWLSSEKSLVEAL